MRACVCIRGSIILKSLNPINKRYLLLKAISQMSNNNKTKTEKKQPKIINNI